MSLQRVRGSTWDTSDNLVCRTLADLPRVDREGIIFVAGGQSPNDGQGGWFMYDPSLPRGKHNGNDVFDPTNTGQGKGCWVRQQYFTAPSSSSFSEIQAAAAGQSEFTLQTFTYSPGQGQLAVYLNGSRLTRFAYAETDINKVTIEHALRLGDVIEFVKYDQPVGIGQQQIHALNVFFDLQHASTGNKQSQLTADNVQEAIEQLEDAITVAMGGALPTASNIGYVAPSVWTAVNVQQALDDITHAITRHGIYPSATTAHQADVILFDDNVFDGGTHTLGAFNVQEAIDELHRRLGKGVAQDIEFDPTNFGSNMQPTDVQMLGEQLYTLTTGLGLELHDHQFKTSGAHNAEAIHYDGTQAQYLPFDGLNNVKEALDVVAAQLENPSVDAENIQVDASNFPVALIGRNVQEALELRVQAFQAHTNDIASGTVHPASRIGYRASLQGRIEPLLQNRALAANVQNALDMIEQLIINHERTDRAHDAENIPFPTGEMGIMASNVKDALLYINQGNWRYEGHLDLTFPPGQSRSNAVNSFWTVPYFGAVDPAWFPLFAQNGQPPITVQGAGYVFEDNSGMLWYMEMPVIQDAIIKHPPAGTSQGIEASGEQDVALTLRLSDLLINKGTKPDQLLLDVHGSAEIKYRLTANSVHDLAGNLRQSAEEVLLDTTGTDFPNVSNTVRAALIHLQKDIGEHVKGIGVRHPADAITLASIANLSSTDVQGGIAEVQSHVERHQHSRNAHAAENISYDPATTGMPVTDLQGAVDEIYRVSGQHPQQATDAHAATAISVIPNKGTIASNNVQAALDELAQHWVAHADLHATDVHHARSILADSTDGNMSFTNVQQGFEALIDWCGEHLAGTDPRHKHMADVINLKTGSGFPATVSTVQEALMHLLAKQMVDEIDGGTF